jgi:two-component system OmpR family sensor kinase
MSSAGGEGRYWQRLRGLPDRTPLRVKMITAVLALVIIALAIISFTSRAVFGDYLMHQDQTQLSRYNQQVSSQFNSNHFRSLFFGDGIDQVWLLNPSGQQIQLFNPGGAPGFNSTQTQQQPPQVPTSQAWLAANADKAVTVPGPPGSNDNWLVITQQIPNVPVTNEATGQTTVQTVTLVVGTNLGNIGQSLDYLTRFDLLVSAAVVIVLAVIGVAVVRASLRPLTDIEHVAAAIAAGDLSSRVPDRDPRTEVGRLGRSLNAMLSQIEAAFDARTRSEEAARRSEARMRQFVADASHELRTPLTAIRGFAEYYRQRGGVAELPAPPDRAALANGGDSASTGPPDASAPAEAPAANGERQLHRADLDRIMQRVEQESSRMGVLVEDMLLLARLDQQRPLEQRPVDMLTIAADTVHDARVVAPQRDISLTVGGGAAPIVLGDEVRLRQVIGNLMTNAINHTPEGASIEVRVRSGSLDEWRAAAAAAAAARWARRGAGETALAVAGRTDAPPIPAMILEVADSGQGLTQQQAEHVFERFYRGDQARTRRSGAGAGLGLSIVAALVAAHGGTVWVQSQPGSGATFAIAIPLAPEARQSMPEPDDSEEPDIIDSNRRLIPGPGRHSRPGPGPDAAPGPTPTDYLSGGPPGPRG